MMPGSPSRFQHRRRSAFLVRACGSLQLRPFRLGCPDLRPRTVPNGYGSMSAMRRRTVPVSVLLAALSVAALALPSAAAALPVVPGTSCTVFPADNVWNMDISKLPVDPNSATWLQSMSASTTNLHPDFGPPKDYGIPFDVVTHAHPTVPVKFVYADESDPGPYPFGSDIHV